MSITKRILEGAQSGLSRLTSLVIVDDEPLSHVESAALQVELTARKAAREKAGRAPLGDPFGNPLAKLATSDPAARAARAQASTERSARIHRERDAREARQKAASDEQFRRMKEHAARGEPSPSGASSAPRGAAGGASGTARLAARGPAARTGSYDAQVAEWFRVLDLPVGADMAQIKSSYRQLMRKYHPDVHASSPQKQKAATELSMRVTTAYNGLVQHLAKR